MKKFLLSIMTLATALTTAFAEQSVTLDFTEPTAWKLANGDPVPTKKADGFGTTPTTMNDGTNSVTVTATETAYFISTSGSYALLVGKPAGSTIDLPQVGFKVGTIKVVAGSGCSKSAKLDLLIDGVAQEKIATLGNSVEYTWEIDQAVAATAQQYTLKGTASSNIQFAQIITY